MALGETPALPAGEHSLVGSAQPSEPFLIKKYAALAVSAAHASREAEKGK